MIMGRDLMQDLGIIIDFQNGNLIWDEVSLSMKREVNKELRPLEKESFSPTKQVESVRTQRITKRALKILDATYSPMRVEYIVDKCTHLNKNQKIKLGSLLRRYSTLTDGTLGKFKTSPVVLEQL